MKAAELPTNEASRLHELSRYEILDTLPEEAFDRLTRLAANMLGTPIALVSLLDETRQWFKSRVGLAAGETPRDIAFCGHAILQDEPFVVSDARDDSRFADNPLVLGAPNVRFYAGAPLKTSSGHSLGTLCVIDSLPRNGLDAAGRQILQDLAAIAVDEMELRLAGRKALLELEQRRVLQARLEAAYRSKSEFLASLSHEMRSPLNSILGMSELLEREIKGPLGDPEYREYARHIHESSAHLLALVGDILEYSKAEAGGIELRYSRFSVAEVVSESVRMVAQFARKKGVALGWAIDPALRLEADRLRVKQMLINLLTNAIKFTPEGGSVTSWARSADNTMVFGVTDTGIGIAAADIEKVLTPFGQIAASGSSSLEGSGLGLPIVKALAERHGGRLEINSAPNQGTSASVMLPTEPPL